MSSLEERIHEIELERDRYAMEAKKAKERTELLAAMNRVLGDKNTALREKKDELERRVEILQDARDDRYPQRDRIKELKFENYLLTKETKEQSLKIVLLHATADAFEHKNVELETTVEELEARVNELKDEKERLKRALKEGTE